MRGGSRGCGGKHMQIPRFRRSRRASALRKRCTAFGTLPAIGGQLIILRPCILNGRCIFRRDGCLMTGQCAARVCCRNRHRRLTVVHGHVGKFVRRKCLAGAGQIAHILNVGGIANTGDLQRVDAIYAVSDRYCPFKIQHIRVRAACVCQSSYVGRDGKTTQRAVLAVHNLVKDKRHRNRIARKVSAARHGCNAEELRFLLILHHDIASQTVQIPAVLSFTTRTKVSIACLIYTQLHPCVIVVRISRTRDSCWLSSSHSPTRFGAREKKGCRFIISELKITCPKLPGYSCNYAIFRNFVILSY